MRAAGSFVVISCLTRQRDAQTRGQDVPYLPGDLSRDPRQHARTYQHAQVHWGGMHWRGMHWRAMHWRAKAPPLADLPWQSLLTWHAKLNRRLLAGRLGNARLSFSFFGLLAVRLVAPFYGGRAGRLLGAVGPACRGQSSSAPTAFGRFDRANQPLSRRGNSYFEVIPALR